MCPRVSVLSVCLPFSGSLGEEMSQRVKYHVVNEFLDRNIYSQYKQKRLAQKSLFAQSFRCYREDEYDGIAVELLDINGQAPVEAPVYACKFGDGETYGHILILANEDGKIALRDTKDRSNQSAIKGQQIHSNAIYDVCWVPGSSEFVTASGDQTAAILGVREDGSLHPVLVLEGHSRSVKTIHVNPFDPSVIATGSRDGSIIIWDKRCKPHYRADEIAPAHHNQASKSSASPSVRKLSQSGSLANNSVTGVIFQQQHKLISSGASDGLIKLWDLRKTHSGGRRDPQCQSVLGHSGKSSHRGFTCMSISPDRDVLYTSCMDNSIYAYHLANPTPSPIAEYTGHVSITYFVKSCLSPCGTYLLSGSSDNSAYLWLTEKPGKPIAKLTGHFAEVTSVGWCPVDDQKLVTCADDMKLRIFRQKNVNCDDFDERMNTRGVSEAYYCEDKEEQKYVKNSNEVSSENSSRTRNGSELRETIPPLPATPSTSRTKIPGQATPSSSKAKEGLSMISPQMHPSTPQQQTPKHRQKGRGRSTPCTPKTSERNTLLQWLTSSKTPGPKESPGTHPLSFSESKKANLKRKLTEFLCEEQENVQENKPGKSPNSSPKKILCSSSSINISDSPSPGVAKMLKYDEVGTSSSSKTLCEDDNIEMNECVKPIEAHDKVALDGGFRKPVTNITTKLLEISNCYGTSKIKCENLSKSPEHNANSTTSKHFKFGLWSSPTANLPNFVIDGSSPHNRSEIRREKKKNIDWLTSFSNQRKLKFSRLPDKAIAGQLGPLAPKQAEKKILKIKCKPVVAALP